MLYVQPLSSIFRFCLYSTPNERASEWCVLCASLVQLEVNIDVMCNNHFSVQHPMSGSTCATVSFGNFSWTVFIFTWTDFTDFKHERHSALLGQILDIHPTFSTRGIGSCAFKPWLHCTGEAGSHCLSWVHDHWLYLMLQVFVSARWSPRVSLIVSWYFSLYSSLSSNFSLQVSWGCWENILGEEQAYFQCEQNCYLTKNWFLLQHYWNF